MRYLTVEEVLGLHVRLLEQSGGSEGLRDRGALASAVEQPRMTFGGEDLYPTVAEKAAVLGFSLAKNHAFVDGNKRVAHAAMEVFLVLNGYEIEAPVDEQERTLLSLAAGEIERDAFANWVKVHLTERS
nr:type II toxin-antitoxin system death-on-curing family toxin [Salisaeta longa]